ncbi:hypothetical protein F8E02_09295 [Methanoculleus sp. Wushi-C6]|uniref:Uncharacterized protein n=1 Tax=Methanoculleus caldifontis TaxID=2651577 RepID=A0ABU3X299_9EURY|nr:hypothetical protein [Methanoculleus sp. Wushi-C6]MDV2482188.1 hypothetical protein [Methanoculleus sp. Wushi-C6]
MILEGRNEALEYIVSGETEEKMEFLVCMIRAGALNDEIQEIIGTSGEPGRKLLKEEYGKADEARTAAMYSALAVFEEYEANGNVSAPTLQAFEDDVGRLRSALDRFADVYRATLPDDGRDLSGDAAAAVTLLAMQEELLESIGESYKYVILGNVEEKEKFSAGMDRFAAGAEAFNATAYLHAGGNAAVAGEYQAMMVAVAEYRSATDAFFSVYERDGWISPEAFHTYEDAVDEMRTAYGVLMASVLANT